MHRRNLYSLTQQYSFSCSSNEVEIAWRAATRDTATARLLGRVELAAWTTWPLGLLVQTGVTGKTSAISALFFLAVGPLSQLILGNMCNSASSIAQTVGSGNSSMQPEFAGSMALKIQEHLGALMGSFNHQFVTSNLVKSVLENSTSVGGRDQRYPSGDNGSLRAYDEGWLIVDRGWFPCPKCVCLSPSWGFLHSRGL